MDADAKAITEGKMIEIPKEKLEEHLGFEKALREHEEREFIVQESFTNQIRDLQEQMTRSNIAVFGNGNGEIGIEKKIDALYIAFIETNGIKKFALQFIVVCGIITGVITAWIKLFNK